MASPSNAASSPSHKRVTDTKGDVPASMDVRRVDASLSAKRLTATLHVTDGAKSGAVHFWLGGDFFAGSADVWIDTWRTGAGVIKTDVRDGEDGFRVHCKGARAVWNAKLDTIKLSAPRS